MTAMIFFEYEVFYNRQGLHSTLGDRSPVLFPKNWINTQQYKSHPLEDEKPREPQLQTKSDWFFDGCCGNWGSVPY